MRFLTPKKKGFEMTVFIILQQPVERSIPILNIIIQILILLFSPMTAATDQQTNKGTCDAYFRTARDIQFIHLPVTFCEGEGVARPESKDQTSNAFLGLFEYDQIVESEGV